jgi:NAD(P)-dependent dehydrogenase (short-subunit alcohol dehydrogenase family)
MKDKICIVTGANSGIGKVTALELARMGAQVVMGCRNMEKGEEALQEIKETSGNDAVSLLKIDLASLQSVRDFVSGFSTEFEHLDVLVNNAGAYIPKRYETEDGFEMTMGVNHLGPVLLTHLLTDALKAAQAARIVNVSSMGHKMARLDLDDLQSKKRFGAMRAYCNSKLANILHANVLAEQLAPHGITANSLHPGVIGSGFAQDEGSAFGFLVKIGKPFIMSPKKGARTSIHLASSADVDGITGKYFVRRKVAKPSKAGRNMELARSLQTLSERLVGIA